MVMFFVVSPTRQTRMTMCRRGSYRALHFWDVSPFNFSSFSAQRSAIQFFGHQNFFLND
jgi:hypothetical protein